MSGDEIRECLLCLRIPLEKIRESVVLLLPVGHDPDAVDRISERAVKLIAAAYERDRPAFWGRKPSGIMASAIYLAMRMEEGLKISQGKIAKALGITEVTLRTGAHKINDLLGLGITRFPDRSERYVCPFCEEVFTFLSDLKLHLWRKKISYSYNLKVWMFNDDGILVDEEILESMKGRTKRKTAGVYIREAVIRKLKKEGRSPGKSVPEPIVIFDKDKGRT